MTSQLRENIAKTRHLHGRLPTRYPADPFNTVGVVRLQLVCAREEVEFRGCGEPRGGKPGPDQERLTLELKLFSDTVCSRREAGLGEAKDLRPALLWAKELSFLLSLLQA